MSLMDLWDLNSRMNLAVRDLVSNMRDPFFDMDWDMAPSTGTSGGNNTQLATTGGNNALSTTGAGGKQDALSTNRMTSMIPRVRVDLISQPDKYVVEAELPGMEKDDIQLSIRDGVLELSGHKKKEQEERKEDPNSQVQYIRRERAFGSFSRSVRLPADAGEKDINAKFNNGILTVNIPREKKPAQKKGSIQIQ